MYTVYKNAYGYLWKLERGQNHEQKMVESSGDKSHKDLTNRIDLV